MEPKPKESNDELKELDQIGEQLKQADQEVYDFLSYEELRRACVDLLREFNRKKYKDAKMSAFAIFRAVQMWSESHGA